MSNSEKIKRIEICACCGGDSFSAQPVLWEGLINEWGLSPAETEFIKGDSMLPVKG
jgi:hypothetical protein